MATRKIESLMVSLKLELSFKTLFNGPLHFKTGHQ